MVFFEIGTALVECVLTILLMDAWFERKGSSTLRLVSVCGLYFLANCCYTLLPVIPIFRTACGVACVFLVAYFLYDLTPLWALSGAVVNLTVNVLIEYLTLVVMNFLGFDTSQLMQYGPERVSYIVIAKLLNIVAIILIASFLGRHKARLSITQAIPLLVCQGISIYICQVLYQTTPYNHSISASYILVLIGLLYINTVMILFIENLTIASKIRQEKALAEQNYVLQRTYYEAVQKDQDNTHALWHDIKKYILAIEAVAVSGNNNALQQNIDFIKKTFAETGNLVDVGNQEGNIILNHCIQKARMSDIDVALSVYIPETLEISAIDLSVIIGNTFDNAIDECQRLPIEARTISVELKQKNGILIYIISNPCLDNPPKKEGHIHGYGLKNVSNCVNKYAGSMDIEKSMGHYQVIIRLNTRGNYH